MRIPEILVITFTFLILLSLSVLVYGLSMGWHIKETKVNEVKIENPVTITLEEASGTQILSVDTFQQLLVLTVLNPGSESQKLILLDPLKGKIYGKILLNNN